MYKLLNLFLCFLLLFILPYGAVADSVYTYSEVVGSLLSTSGASLMPPNWYTTAYKQGSTAAMSQIDVAGEPFNKALRFTVSKQGNTAWDAQVFFNFTSTIKKGDVLFYAYKIRGIESQSETGKVRVNGRLRVDSSDVTSTNCDGMIEPNNAWTQVFAAGTAPFDSTGSSSVCIHLALAKQTFDIADLIVINFGKNVSLNSLPLMEQVYEGMEENAPWRVAASERIDNIRKASVKVIVKDRNGKLVPDADISINQKKHAYGFGSIINTTPFQNQQYKDTLKSFSNRSGFENELKMNYIGSSSQNISNALDWFKQNDMDVRGHTLIWGDFARLPDDRRNELMTDPEALMQFTLDHITEYVDRYKDDIYIWDVINEPYSSTDFTDLLGNEAMIDWLWAARQADPNAKLCINDYEMLSYNKNHQDYLYNLIEYLNENEAPLDVIGMQGHVELVAPEKILSVLDRFAELGKEIEITEFTFSTRDEELQAKFTRDFLTAVFSHPSTTSIVTWGFWQSWMFNPEAAMYRPDFSIKPNGEVWMDLIYNQWWTKEKGVTDSEGSYSARAFLGTHEITANKNGVETKYDITLSKDGETIVMVLDGTPKSESVSISHQNGKIRIQGSNSFAGGEEITLFITEGGLPVCADQKTRENGEFLFDITPTGNISNQILKVGSTGRQPFETEFRLYMPTGGIIPKGVSINNTALPSGFNINVKADIANKLGTTSKVTLVAVVLNEQNKMMSCEIKSDSISNNSDKKLSVELEIPNDDSKYFIKTFLLDEIEFMRPLSNYIIFG